MITLNVEYQKEKPVLMLVNYTTSQGRMESFTGFFSSIEDAFFYTKDRRDYIIQINIKRCDSAKEYNYEKIRGLWTHEEKIIKLT
jgi:hypothetical protein